MSVSINKLKLIVWVNIFAQISGPFFGLTSVAFANTDKQDVDTQSVSTFTKKYTVGVGFVAQRFKRQHSAHLNKTQVTTWV